jgi:hypothetical protein
VQYDRIFSTSTGLADSGRICKLTVIVGQVPKSPDVSSKD